MSTLAITHVRPTRATRSGEVRLTRRGRLVVFLGALALLLAAAVFWGAGSVATERPGTPEPTRVVLVEEGDTLWAIAAAVTTDGDVRATIEHIERLNALDSALLQAGQRLRVPVAD